MNTTNNIRARRCQTALRVYGNEFDTRTYLIDLLADARHWCDQHDEPYGDIDRMAYEHYCAEVAGRHT